MYFKTAGKVAVFLVWYSGFFFILGFFAKPPTPPNIEWTTVILRVAEGHGSGVYIGAGNIITAAHVAKDADKDGKMDVALTDGTTGTATVQWYDTKSDVALVKLDAPIKGLKAADLACGTPDMTHGDEVEVIGFPLSIGETRTWGRVSRNLKHGGDRGDGDYIVINATIAHGNSGGPVFTMKDGKVAGIVSAVAVDSVMGIPSMVAFGIIVPRSVICGQMNKKHDAPTFGKPVAS